MQESDLIEKRRKDKEQQQRIDELKRGLTWRELSIRWYFALLFLASAAGVVLLILGILSGPIGWLALGGMLGLALIGTALAAVTGPAKLTLFAVVLGITAVLVGAACIAASVLLFLALISNPFGWMAIAAAILIVAAIILITAINYTQRPYEQAGETLAQESSDATKLLIDEEGGYQQETSKTPTKQSSLSSLSATAENSVTGSTKPLVGDKGQTQTDLDGSQRPLLGITPSSETHSGVSSSGSNYPSTPAAKIKEKKESAIPYVDRNQVEMVFVEFLGGIRSDIGSVDEIETLGVRSEDSRNKKDLLEGKKQLLKELKRIIKVISDVKNSRVKYGLFTQTEMRDLIAQLRVSENSQIKENLGSLEIGLGAIQQQVFSGLPSSSLSPNFESPVSSMKQLSGRTFLPPPISSSSSSPVYPPAPHVSPFSPEFPSSVAKKSLKVDPLVGIGEMSSSSSSKLGEPGNGVVIEEGDKPDGALTPKG